MGECLPDLRHSGPVPRRSFRIADAGIHCGGGAMRPPRGLKLKFFRARQRLVDALLSFHAVVFGQSQPGFDAPRTGP
jgi:hypothetical protein